MIHTARLVDAGGQHHDRISVEDDLKLQAHLLNGLKHRGMMRHPGVDNNLPDADRIAGQLPQAP